MIIKKTAVAGTMESSDIFVTIEPTEKKGIEIYLKSPVIKQFGEEITELIKKTLQKMKVENAIVRAIDKGALNCTVEARVACAVMRATEAEYNIWEVTSGE